ncbi:MAG: enoyl-CoA hydratase-related protein [Actinomycetota bacterium]
MSTPQILLERHGRVALVTLNRPDALNALSTSLLADLLAATEPLDSDPDVGCIVVTGAGRAFAAGADVVEMSTKSYAEVAHADLFAGWDRFAALRTPKVAAVNGFALGGGCELAMMCDTIYAAESARFGQPEITLGIIPGMGGSQRLTRLIGKSKAMDLILTGRMIDAAEAERCGLAARVFPDDELLEQTLDVATTIAEFGKLATMAAREAVDRALELPLSEGVRFERRAFHALFATEDQPEGMAAFLEKREPEFRHR